MSPACAVCSPGVGDFERYGDFSPVSSRGSASSSLPIITVSSLRSPLLAVLLGVLKQLSRRVSCYSRLRFLDRLPSDAHNRAVRGQSSLGFRSVPGLVSAPPPGGRRVPQGHLVPVSLVRFSPSRDSNRLWRWKQQHASPAGPATQSGFTAPNSYHATSNVARPVQ
jgi:hypothetical protein